MLKSIYYLSIIYNLTEKLLLVTLLREKKTYKVLFISLLGKTYFTCIMIVFHLHSFLNFNAERISIINDLKNHEWTTDKII